MAIVGAILGDIAGSQYEFGRPIDLDWNVYTDQDGELCYTVETCFKEKIIEQLSNENLLNELKRRMVIE